MDYSMYEWEQMKTDLEQMKTDLVQMKTDLVQMKTDLVQTKIDLEQTKSDLEQMKTKLKQLSMPGFDTMPPFSQGGKDFLAVMGMSGSHCSCCYSLIIHTDMNVLECQENCRVCQKCMEKCVAAAIRRYPNMELKCPGIACNNRHSSKSLQDVIRPKLYSKIVQLEEVKLAGIEELQFCFYCDFVAEVPKCVNIFKCLNSKCKKSTCRWCMEPAHIPNGCNASQKNVKARTYVENAMSEAFGRTCCGCKRKYYIDDGCNVVECICGVTMCYFCGNPIKGNLSRMCRNYCSRNLEPEIFSRNNVIVAAKKAMKEVDDELTIHAIAKLTELLHSTIPREPKTDYEYDEHYFFGVRFPPFYRSAGHLHSELIESDSFENKSKYDHRKPTPNEQIQYYGHLAVWTIGIVCSLAKFSISQVIQ